MGVQSSQEDSDASAEAPASTVYEGHSDGILGTLASLTDKAEGQLSQARKAEQTAARNFEMLKQSLSDEVKFANKDMDQAKKNLAANQETKATSEGDLAATSKDLEA